MLCALFSFNLPTTLRAVFFVLYLAFKVNGDHSLAGYSNASYFIRVKYANGCLITNRQNQPLRLHACQIFAIDTPAPPAYLK